MKIPRNKRVSEELDFKMWPNKMIKTFPLRMSSGSLLTAWCQRGTSFPPRDAWDGMLQKSVIGHRGGGTSGYIGLSSRGEREGGTSDRATAFGFPLHVSDISWSKFWSKVKVTSPYRYCCCCSSSSSHVFILPAQES